MRKIKAQCNQKREKTTKCIFAVNLWTSCIQHITATILYQLLEVYETILFSTSGINSMTRFFLGFYSVFMLLAKKVHCGYVSRGHELQYLLDYDTNAKSTQ